MNNFMKKWGLTLKVLSMVFILLIIKRVSARKIIVNDQIPINLTLSI